MFTNVIIGDSFNLSQLPSRSNLSKILFQCINIIKGCNAVIHKRHFDGIFQNLFSLSEIEKALRYNPENISTRYGEKNPSTTAYLEILLKYHPNENIPGRHEGYSGQIEAIFYQDGFYIKFGGGSVYSRNPYIIQELDALEYTMEAYIDGIKELFDIISGNYGYMGLQNKWNEYNKISMANKLKVNEIHWINIFGKKYIDHYGRDYFMDAPGYKIEELKNGGVFYQPTNSLIIQDDENAISQENVINYFQMNDKIKSLKYVPVYRREILPKNIQKPISPEEGISWAVSDIKNYFNLDLDHTPKSLKHLDYAITNIRSLNSLRHYYYGCYFGNVIIKNLGGKWIPSLNISENKITDLNNIDDIYPMFIISERFNKKEESLLKIYNKIKKKVK
jgi:hypothetical protein